MKLIKTDIRLTASPEAVVLQYLYLPGTDRVANMVKRVKAMSREETETVYQQVIENFAGRHRNIEDIFNRHCEKVETQHGSLSHFSSTQRLLLGAFFTKEYSIQSAALFNPSIVPYPDQRGTVEGGQRFVMSLRATGEGHISSIIFATGSIGADDRITLDTASPYFTILQKEEHTIYDRKLLLDAASVKGIDTNIFEKLPPAFTATEAIQLLKKENHADAVAFAEDITDSNYTIQSSPHIPLNEKVIFPSGRAESMGMEDVRLVRFTDGGTVCYYGTYTAYNGREIKTQLIETTDFQTFKVRTLQGTAIADKGMALFPQKVNGQYVMISRQGGEKISIMYSHDLYRWDSYETLMEPVYPWEMVQLGNCGSPIKTDKGWLLLTHGVGAVRTYVISAILLHLNNPSQIIGRLKEPLIKADEQEREGYVPNVVYTCGFMQNGDTLIIPYAVSDSATGFATVQLNDLLNSLEATGV